MRPYEAKNEKTSKPKISAVKTVCVILMILFTLALAADIVNLFITPARDQIVFRPANIQAQDGSFSPPEDGPFSTPGGIPSAEAGSEIPVLNAFPSGRQKSFLQTVRRAWLPILIVCVLGDAASLLCYLRLGRKQRASSEIPENISGMEPLEEDDLDEPPKRKHGPWIAIICLAVVFALILSMVPTSGGSGSSVTVQKEVRSGTPEAVRINTILSGAGTLEADCLTAVTVPKQVTVLKYHVRNGETVAKGDPLVTVDKTSAASAMMELQTVLKELDSDLEAERQKEKSAYITVSASGRVKKIYADVGDSVSEVLYNNGALMLLSLDGLMKVSFTSEQSLTVGDAVTVTYSGGSEEGQISSVREGKVTVTVSDKDIPYGAEVIVKDGNGQAIGEGTAAANSEYKVIGYYGTVKNLSVSVGDKVSAGTTLMVLKDTGRTTDYQLLLARRQELDAQMEKLSQLSETGMILAENDGTVSGVPDNAEIELLSANGSPKVNTLAASSGGYRLILLSNVTVSDPDSPSSDASTEQDTPDGAGENPDGGQDGDGTLEGGGSQGGNEGEGGDSSGTTLNGTYSAKLAGISGGNLYVYYDPSGGNQMTEFGIFAYDGDVLLTEDGITTAVPVSQLREGDLLQITVSDGTVTNVTAQRSASTPDAPDGSMPGGEMGGISGGGMVGSMGGGAGGSFSGSVTKTPAYAQYDLAQTELLYVSSQEEVSLTITVDELDILSLQNGLDAQITLDAMKGQSFQGTVKKIGHEGVNDGGNTKFTVTVTLPREAAMLDGMNASVKIVTTTSEASAAIPSAALVEDDGKTYVYTDYNEKEDALGGLTEVETGASDGEFVEILSGLGPGDTFYYRYADTVSYHFLTA